MKKFMCCFFSFSFLFANFPQPVVQYGNADLKVDKNGCKITTSHTAILNWNSFAVDEGKVCEFIQPNAQSRVLNRVIGNEMSAIQGKLLANGNVWIINPNGILFGPSSVIETASLLASSLNVSDNDFLGGNEALFFGQDTKGIHNQGSILAYGGDVILIGTKLNNEGQISASSGAVRMGAGVEVLFKPGAHEQIFIRPHLEGQFENGIKPGNIQALSVELKADGNLYAKAIRHEGKIDALNFEEKGGDVYLVAVGGDVEVSGQITAKKGRVGGTVHLLGNQVAILDGAQINVSGYNGGGTVLVGGDQQGTGEVTARMSSIHKGAKIFANAQENGDGGKVILWADQIASFYGFIDARGGIEGGNGGFVEVSGHDSFIYEGHVTTGAPKGKIGTLLLDPTNDITISTFATDGLFNPPLTYEGSGFQPANLRNTDLVAALNGPNNVIIQNDPKTAGGNGDIIVSARVAWLSDGSLTFNATRDLDIRNNVVSTGGGTITCNVGRDLLVNARISFPSSTPALIDTTGSIICDVERDVLVQGATYAAPNTAAIGTSALSTTIVAGGNLTVQAGTGFTAAAAISGENLNLDIQGDILLQASTGTGGSARIGNATATSTTTVVSGGSLSLALAGSITSVILQGGMVDIVAGGDISMTAFGVNNVCNIHGQNQLLATAGGSINMDGNNTNTGCEFILSGLGELTIKAGGDINMMNNASIESASPATINIVVDNLFPSYPKSGAGSFYLDANSGVYPGGGEGTVRIYTSKQSQNQILGNIKGLTFSPGPLFVNSTREIWSTYFPSSSEGIPFTIFYKDPFFINPQEEAFIALSEMFRFLHPFDEYIRWKLRFSEVGTEKEEYILRKRKHKDQEILLPVHHWEL